MLTTRKLTELVSVLQENGYPVAQMQWYPKSAPDFPYCTLVPLGTNNTFTDNNVAYSPVPYELNLFTETREIAVEKRFQSLLESIGVPWQRSNYFRNEGVVACYEITLIEE